MQDSIYAPQRQSKVGILIIYAKTIQSFVRAWWPFIVVPLLKQSSDKMIYYGLGALTVLIVLSLVAFLKYKNFTFYIDQKKDCFVVNEGILRKTRTEIPLTKIQQVNINQSLLQKLVQVYSLAIDTAGSSQKEIEIKAINHELALLLKENILDSSTEMEERTEQTTRTKVSSTPIMSIDMLTLLKVGVTTSYGRTIVLMIGFVAAFMNTVQDIFFAKYEIDEEQIDATIGEVSAGIGVLIFIFFVLVLVIILNLVRTFIKHFDFQMVKQAKSLLVSSGLFAKKNTLLSPKKVQIIEQSQNFFQRKLGFLDMRIYQASSDEFKTAQGNSSVEVPGCSPQQKDQILRIILNTIPETNAHLSHNWRFLLSRFLFSMLLPFGIYAVISSITDSFFDYLHWALLIELGIGLIIYFSYRNGRLSLSNDFIQVKSGAWDVDVKTIEPHKIQGIKLTQYFWHKSVNVGHIQIYTAGGAIAFSFAAFDKLKEWTNLWLYKVETSKRPWM